MDERLMLKLLKFFGWHSSESIENADESDFETQRILAEASSVHAKRYYFGLLKIGFSQVSINFEFTHINLYYFMTNKNLLF